ncbi:Oidioi.mRNA.OKI2018_I69.PAR.g9672.t1.cds [Oikopleura dioica]|uniref:Oidioi.mRNA.OKI2018_I69.PAR.g9672.t1.cds n=1 Tax=Oikopleura dioica TaxID=34765 RepID=A0ABN7RLQ0_OIKDI|nr:Oidioi.mRNA.OKI2018_I69.PAR.g9672.t1.cds [Oikopleura dioica]
MAPAPSTLRTPSKPVILRTPKRPVLKRKRDEAVPIVPVVLDIPLTPQKTPGKKEEDVKVKLKELLEDETLRDTVIKEKSSHRKDLDYDIFALSYREAGETRPTFFVYCDHEYCRNDLNKALYRAVGAKSKNRKLDAGAVTRHENTRHFNKTKALYSAVAEAVVGIGLPLDVFDHPLMKKSWKFSTRSTRTASRGTSSKNIFGEITDRIKKRALQLANEGRVAICLDNYDHQSAKYCGILLCTFGTEGTKCLRWFISFRRVLDCSDKGMRTHLRDILAEYGLISVQLGVVFAASYFTYDKAPFLAFAIIILFFMAKYAIEQEITFRQQSAEDIKKQLKEIEGRQTHEKAILEAESRKRDQELAKFTTEEETKRIQAELKFQDTNRKRELEQRRFDQEEETRRIQFELNKDLEYKKLKETTARIEIENNKICQDKDREAKLSLDKMQVKADVAKHENSLALKERREALDRESKEKMHAYEMTLQEQRIRNQHEIDERKVKDARAIDDAKVYNESKGFFRKFW